MHIYWSWAFGEESLDMVFRLPFVRCKVFHY